MLSHLTTLFSAFGPPALFFVLYFSKNTTAISLYTVYQYLQHKHFE